MNVIQLFKYLIHSKSETPDDGGILNFVEDYLEGFEAIRIDGKEVKNLFIYKKFQMVSICALQGMWMSFPQVRDGTVTLMKP